MATQCAGCDAKLLSGVIGLTDELEGSAGLVPKCETCLFSIDRRLTAAWITPIAGLNLAAFDLVIERLLKMPDFSDLAEITERRKKNERKPN